MKLSDYFIPLIAFVKSFERGDNRAAQELSDEIDSLIHQAQGKALKDGVELASFQAAMYPVLAWADERISRHHKWDDEHAWQRFLLQRRYFKTGMAGREFFDRLQQLDEDDVQVREVYVMCLCLGFLGRYSMVPNSAELAALRVDQYQVLQRADKSLSDADRSVLFPQAYGLTPAPAGRARSHSTVSRRRWSRLLFFIVPPLVVLLLAYGLHALLTESVQQFREAANL